MAKHWRILGLSLLALIGVLAVNASAAQAEWRILEEVEGKAKSVTSIELTGSGEGGYLLSENGSKIHCTAAAGGGTASLSEANKKLSGTATITFTGCKDEGFSKTCTVHSVGKAAEIIVASAPAVAEMSGEEVFAKATSSSFTTIVYEGAKCPLNEAEEPVSGTAKLTILEPLVFQKVHVIHLKVENVKLGASKAEIHMIKEGTSETLPLLLGTIEQKNGHPFSVHLCNLPEAPVC